MIDARTDSGCIPVITTIGAPATPPRSFWSTNSTLVVPLVADTSAFHRMIWSPVPRRPVDYWTWADATKSV